LLLIPEFASAAADTGIMDSVMKKYQEAASKWGDKMIGYASWIFWGLALISMVWTYGLMILRKADIGEFFAETIRFFATLGFFWWILMNGPLISQAIIKSMWQIGTAVVEGGNSYTPSGITDIGFKIFFKAVDESSSFSPVDSAAAILISACVLVVLALVAVNMLVLFVSSWILMYGGVIFLGFGGSRWTSDIAITFYKTVLGVGTQLLAMVLLVGIGKNFIDQTYASMSEGINLKELGVLGITVVVLLYLIDKIPPMLAGIVGGSSTAGIGGFGAAAAMGAAVAAAGIAAGVAGAAASMAAGGATNLAGAGSALKAAFQSAQENMGSSGGGGGGNVGGGGGSNDTGSIGGSEGGGGSGSSGGGNSGGGSNGGGGSSFGQAMGTAGRFAADMGSALASGAKSGLSAKASSVAASFNERAANTMGGKLASEINGSAGQARADQQTLAQAAAINQGQQLQEARDTVAENSSTETSSHPESGSGSVNPGNEEVNEFVNGKA
jgi:P-type conjugative transfer protein TrbL